MLAQTAASGGVLGAVASAEVAAQAATGAVLAETGLPVLGGILGGILLLLGAMVMFFRRRTQGDV